MGEAPDFSAEEAVDVLVSIFPGGYVLRVDRQVARVGEDSVDVAVGGYVLSFAHDTIDRANLGAGGRCEVTAGAERDRILQEDYALVDDADG